ncbi:hypothetical protein ACF1BQ_020630 [Bradyrhizobium sp. RDT10]
MRKEKFSAWDEVPRFDYLEEPIISVVTRLAPAVGALLLAALGFGILSWLALRRQMVA